MRVATLHIAFSSSVRQEADINCQPERHGACSCRFHVAWSVSTRGVAHLVLRPLVSVRLRRRRVRVIQVPFAVEAAERGSRPHGRGAICFCGITASWRALSAPRGSHTRQFDM